MTKLPSFILTLKLFTKCRAFVFPYHVTTWCLRYTVVNSNNLRFALHTKLVVVVVRVKVCLINFSIWGGVFHTPPSTTVYILKCLLHTGRTYLRSPQFNDDDTKCQSLTAREDGVFIFIRTTRRQAVENHKSSES